MEGWRQEPHAWVAHACEQPLVSPTCLHRHRSTPPSPPALRCSVAGVVLVPWPALHAYLQAQRQCMEQDHFLSAGGEGGALGGKACQGQGWSCGDGWSMCSRRGKQRLRGLLLACVNRVNRAPLAPPRPLICLLCSPHALSVCAFRGGGPGGGSQPAAPPGALDGLTSRLHHRASSRPCHALLNSPHVCPAEPCCQPAHSACQCPTANECLHRQH